MRTIALMGLGAERVSKKNKKLDRAKESVETQRQE
jgi:hypothetical protein